MSTMITIRIKDDFLQQIDDYACKLGYTRSALIKEALKAHISQELTDSEKVVSSNSSCDFCRRKGIDNCPIHKA